MKKLIASFLVIICLVALFGCVKTIEDTNGDADKTLATITDEKLKTISGRISIGKSYKSGSPSVQRYEDAGGFSDEEYDYDEIEISFTKLNGTVKAMITYLDKNQKLTICCSSHINKGNFTAVLLSPEREIIARFAADEEKTITVTAGKSGDYLLIIAGESCDGSVSLNRNR